MTDSVVRLETDAATAAPRKVTIRWLTDRRASNVALASHGSLGPLGPHTALAEDFFAIALATYCADRSVRREIQPDGWTRHLTIEVPVRHPDGWDTDALAQTFGFLTGDHWRLTLRAGEPHPGLRTTATADPLDAAVLFSGGVDSLAGASETAATGQSIALVSYFGDTPTGSLQHDLAHSLNLVDRHHAFRLTTNLQPSDPWPGFVDTTMRSRSVLFLALGLLVARSHHAQRLQMAENGYIALNVPLHEGRAGTLSTRTAHPGFLDRLNQQITSAGLGTHIDNPYLPLTKGEVTERLLQTLPHLAARTISCTHPIGRWHGDGFRNCGYCYPCIIRQAGFHHTGSDPTPYGTDPFTDPDFYANHPDASSDIRSVARFLLEPIRLGDLFATGPIGNYATALALHEMRVRGVAELTQLFRTRLSPPIQNLLGL